MFMKWFRKMYVLGMNAKLFMALYFIVMVFAQAVAVLLSGGDSIRLLTMLEMLMTCAVVAVLQWLLLSDSADYSGGVLFGRSVLWLLLSMAVITGAALLFQWFAGYPWWATVAFVVFMLLMLVMTLEGLKFEREAETVRLNSDLERYKAKK